MGIFEKHCHVRVRDRSISCSDKMWEEIRFVTKDAIPISAFIRRAIENELKKGEYHNRNNKSTELD